MISELAMVLQMSIVYTMISAEEQLGILLTHGQGFCVASLPRRAKRCREADPIREIHVLILLI